MVASQRGVSGYRSCGGENKLRGRIGRQPAVSFAFSNNTFVPSDVVVDIQGATAQVLVNVRDVASAAGPAREQAGQHLRIICEAY